MSLLVVALAIALRVAWVLAVPSKPVGDFAMYVEAAAHLVQHGSFDSEYVYMPGYVLLIAPVQALGGGWLATKLVGAVLGGLGAGPVCGIARRLGGGRTRVALVAGLIYALWPAGIAVASVTGTDMPAAVLVLVASYFLLRYAEPRPVLAAILFGLVTGLAAYIRAIVVPLAALAVLVFRAVGKPWRKSLAWAGTACAIALFVLSPWAVRNRLRYGETFLTDSHGGLTALVGANPNTLGCYSRSLNRIFRDVTGFTLLAEPHRQADRAALAIAKTWVGFDPRFSLGLFVRKAERLLVHERALLYWPLFRAGVLPEPYRSFFGSHQAAIEGVADSFYLVILALALFGSALAYARRNWLALSLLPQAVALALLYSAIFAEARYRLPIFMLLIPFSALAVDWLVQTGRDLACATPSPRWKREAMGAATFVALVYAGAPVLAWAGAELRQRHAWVVSECVLEERPQFCRWRAVEGSAGVAGVWNGVGLALEPDGRGRGGAMEVQLPLPAGEYTAAAALEVAPLDSAPPAAAGSVLISSRDNALSSQVALGEVARSSHAGKPYAWRAGFHHPGGLLFLRVQVEPASPPGDRPTGRLWLSDLRLLVAIPGRGSSTQKFDVAGTNVRDLSHSVGSL